MLEKMGNGAAGSSAGGVTTVAPRRWMPKTVEAEAETDDSDVEAEEAEEDAGEGENDAGNADADNAGGDGKASTTSFSRQLLVPVRAEVNAPLVAVDAADVLRAFAKQGIPCPPWIVAGKQEQAQAGVYEALATIDAKSYAKAIESVDKIRIDLGRQVYVGGVCTVDAVVEAIAEGLGSDDPEESNAELLARAASKISGPATRARKGPAAAARTADPLDHRAKVSAHIAQTFDDIFAKGLCGVQHRVLEQLRKKKMEIEPVIALNVLCLAAATSRDTHQRKATTSILTGIAPVPLPVPPSSPGGDKDGNDDDDDDDNNNNGGEDGDETLS